MVFDANYWTSRKAKKNADYVRKMENVLIEMVNLANDYISAKENYRNDITEIGKIEAERECPKEIKVNPKKLPKEV